ncbi:Peroxisomal bifunctional enzyme [Nymphon striatum]|nr:Peroxisomal bifunctional enzyme [Nymphon striatum]
MDPEVEIEQAIQEAKKQDQALRNQAAKVIAHRTTIEQRMEKAADQVGEARETAKQALMRAEQSKAQGDAAGVDKWTNAAQSLAMRLQASENNLDSLKDQYEIAMKGIQIGLLLGVAIYITIGIFEAVWAVLLDDLGAETWLVGCQFVGVHHSDDRRPAMNQITESVSLEREGDVALVVVNNPPVNALSSHVRQGIFDAMTQAQESDATAIVLICEGRTFIAGADITEFGAGMGSGASLSDAQQAMENNTKPVVAAIHGTALGGGLEVGAVCALPGGR